MMKRDLVCIQRTGNLKISSNSEHSCQLDSSVISSVRTTIHYMRTLICYRFLCVVQYDPDPYTLTPGLHRVLRSSSGAADLRRLCTLIIRVHIEGNGLRLVRRREILEAQTTYLRVKVRAGVVHTLRHWLLLVLRIPWSFAICIGLSVLRVVSSN